MRKYFLILVVISIFVSCEKEPGCTDSTAINFSPSAKKDDGTCRYTGSVCFWTDQETYPLAIYRVRIQETGGRIEYDYLGTLTTHHSSAITDCSQSVNATFPEGHNTYEARSLSPFYDGEYAYNEFCQGSFTITKDQCTIIKVERRPNMGRVTFWTKDTNLVYHSCPEKYIRVKLSNRLTQVNKAFITDPGCNTDSTANFVIAPGTYNYSVLPAKTNTVLKSGVLTVTAGCTTFEIL